MKTLDQPRDVAAWLRSTVRGALQCDSRRLKPGDGFVAWPGAATDGRRFVAAALKAGATTCLVEREGLEAFAFDDARIASLPGLKAATGPIADAFFEQPSAALDVIATTMWRLGTTYILLPPLPDANETGTGLPLICWTFEYQK